MTEIVGADISYARPDPGSVKAAGYTFVMGYVSTSSSAKCLPVSYANRLRAAGLDVGLVFENEANRALQGAAAGTADGKAAEAQANALGYPVTAGILAAVDFDVTVEWGAVGEYLRAFNLATRRPVGPYGERDVIERFVTPGSQPCQIGWQTAAWSGGELSQKANLYQRVGHHHPLISGIGASDFDEDVLCKPFPFWGSAAAAPVSPPRRLVPLVHTVRAGENLTVIARNNRVTVAQIVAWNHIPNPNRIYPGQRLTVGWR
jgi:nucleoid-associated protein YgaU